jgi:hypothetical protein
MDNALNGAVDLQKVTTVSIAFIENRWINDEFGGEPTFLLMNNRSIHTRPSFRTTLRDRNVKMTALPPLAVDISQALDCTLFGELNKRTKHKLAFGNHHQLYLEGSSLAEVKTF